MEPELERKATDALVALDTTWWERTRAAHEEAELAHLLEDEDG
jgi:hypothetical protein